MHKIKTLVVASVFGTLGLVSGHSAQAGVISPGFVDLDGAGAGVAVAPFISLDVMAGGAGEVVFTIGSTDDVFTSVIEQINFDNGGGVLDTFVSLSGSAGVDFDEDLANLPQGNSIGFTSDFGFQAGPPPPQNGIGDGESLSIVFDLASGFSVTDVVDALGSGDLRIGLHVISINPAGAADLSDTLITPTTPPPAPVPLPATGLLLIGALGGLVLRKRMAG